MPRLFQELKRRNVFKVAVAYLAAAWVLLQVAEYLVSVLSLPDWTNRLILLLLAIGFVPALILSWAYELTPEGIVRDDRAGEREAPVRTRGVGRYVTAVTLFLVAGAAAYWYSGKDERWARDVAFPEINRLADQGLWEEAYAVARTVQARLPGNQDLESMWQGFSFITNIQTTPEGASVFRRPYGQPGVEWEPLGETPLLDIQVPRGLSLLRFELEGRPDFVRVIGGETAGSTRLAVRDVPVTDRAQFAPGAYVFDTPDSRPPRMVRVPGHTVSIDGENVLLSDFYIGEYEVTNREFKQFVDDGGYEEPRFWQYAFVENGRELTWQEAMAGFTDGSGRPGPSTWMAGTFPDSQEDYPVSGVSWYEAAAYAEYTGFDLPTLHHWRRANSSGMLSWQLSHSNVESDGPVAVGQSPGLDWTAAADMVGNVREWTYNALDDQRVIVGGSYGDLAYQVQHSIADPFRLPPMSRSPENGFRIADHRDGEPVSQRLQRPVGPGIPDVVMTEPVSDEVYRAYLTMFDYDRRPLEPEIEETKEYLHWTRERVTITSSSAGERLALYIFLPTIPATRYQAVIYWPSTTALVRDTIDQQAVHLDFLLRNGRAVIYPVYDGVLERRRSAFPDWSSIDGRDLVIQAMKDMRRTIDYLESRADVDGDAIGFYGLSWGGRLGPMALAIDSRLKVAVLNQAGLQHLAIPEISVLNYLPRVTQPVLQMNGRFDTDFLFETSAIPFFELLGSDPDHKKHVVGDTGHFVPRADVIGETLDWLDEYLGPVN